MKRNSKAIRLIVRIVVLVLVLLLAVLPILGAVVSAAGSDWYAIQTDRTGLDEGLVYEQGTYYYDGAGDRFAENMILYTPGGDVQPLVAFGQDIYGAATMARAVSLIEATGKKVVAAANGDFFTVATGVSIGMVVKNGILCTGGDPDYYVCAFDARGNATIGQGAIHIDIDGTTMKTKLSSVLFNKVLTNYNGVVLFDSNFGTTNRCGESAVNYVLEPVSGAMKMGSTMTVRVAEITTSSMPVTLTAGRYVLSFATGSLNPTQMEAAAQVQVGDLLTVSCEGAAFLTGAQQVVSGGDLLIKDGKNVAPGGSTRAPRTAIGIKADGTVLVYTVDGRQTGYSCGMTYKELAQRLLELGCTQALNLDGGGSTTMEVLYPGNSTLTLVNKPSEGSLRSCANYLFFVTEQKAAGTATKLHLYPSSESVLAGAAVQLDVKATDDYYTAVAMPGAVTYSVSGPGTVRSGVFTAGSTAGTAVITAKAGQATGTANMRVYTTPDAVTIHNEASGTEVFRVTLTAGQTYNFKGGANADLTELVATDRCFTWSCDDFIGTIDADGVFTAGNETGYGFVTASVGGVEADVMVTIVPKGQCLMDFEGASVNGTGTDCTYKTFTGDKEYVKFGQADLQLTYKFSAGDEAVLPLQAALKSGTTDLNFWFYGDRSQNTLQVTFRTEEGEQAVSYGLIDFGGWKQIFVDVPAGAQAITAITVAKTGSKTSGTLYLDQMVASDGFYYDRTAPFVELTVEGRQLTATLADDKDGAIPRSRVTVTYDGKEIDFTYYEEAQSLTAMLPAADCYDHQVAVTAGDLSGNTFRAFIAMPADEADDGDTSSRSSSVSTEAAPIPFTDTAGHWAESYANYLYQQKLSEGIETSSGLQYQPNAQMTRQEIAVMIARWLGVMGKYDDVVLPYADANRIASWALPAAKAMYALGIITGSEEGSKVYFLPNDVLTRETIMTMLGRMQDRGYEESSMNFSDADQISDWAYTYVASLVGQGIVSGDNGKLRPGDPVTRGEAAKIICCLY